MKHYSAKKLALAGMFCAVAVVGSVFSFPVFGSKCAPVQHTHGTMIINPKKPYTTDGIPANSSTPGFIMRYNGLGQNLAKNTAAKIPIGTPTMIAPAVT